MRIVFLGSSLDAGRNGVGDYIRRLVGELGRQGHSALALGLADTEDALDAHDPVVRLDRRRPWPQRLLQARAALAGFNPDWVSLQFVPYAWHPRGYALGLATRLAPLFKGRRRHVMFHELWVGLNRRDRFINRLHGIVQRRAALGLHRDLRPHLVHTQAPAYRATLAAEGIPATLLPLFSSLPVETAPHPAVRHHFLATHAPALLAARTVIAGWFGTVHPEWDGGEIVGRLATAAQASGRQLLLVALGRTGGAGAALAAALRRDPPTGATFVELGELPPAEAARTIAAFDLALTPNPLALVPKSGTVATFLDHGVPVLVTRDDWAPRAAIAVPPLDEPLVRLAPPGTPLELGPLLALRRAPAPRLPAIAAQFISDLAASA